MRLGFERFLYALFRGRCERAGIRSALSVVRRGVSENGRVLSGI